MLRTRFGSSAQLSGDPGQDPSPAARPRQGPDPSPAASPRQGLDRPGSPGPVGSPGSVAARPQASPSRPVGSLGSPAKRLYLLLDHLVESSPPPTARSQSLVFSLPGPTRVFSSAYWQIPLTGCSISSSDLLFRPLSSPTHLVLPCICTCCCCSLDTAISLRLLLPYRLTLSRTYTLSDLQES